MKKYKFKIYALLIDDKKVENINENIDLTKKEIIIKKGKKTFLKVKIL